MQTSPYSALNAMLSLGLLCSLYLRFDPPISSGDGDTAQPTHFQGLNIHETTILVCRVKRTVFLLQDTTYRGVWVSAKNQYYKKYNLRYGQLHLSDASSPFIMRV